MVQDRPVCDDASDVGRELVNRVGVTGLSHPRLTAGVIPRIGVQSRTTRPRGWLLFRAKDSQTGKDSEVDLLVLERTLQRIAEEGGSDRIDPETLIPIIPNSPSFQPFSRPRSPFRAHVPPFLHFNPVHPPIPYASLTTRNAFPFIPNEAIQPGRDHGDLRLLRTWSIETHARQHARSAISRAAILPRAIHLPRAITLRRSIPPEPPGVG